MRLISFFILLKFLFFTTAVFADNEILDVTKLTQSPVSLTSYFSIFEDTSAILTFSDIQTPEIVNHFQSTQKPAESLSYGYTASAYWLRLVLQNSSDQSTERMLEIGDARISSLQFYQSNSDKTYSVITTGFKLPFATRAYKNRYFIFPIVLPSHSEQTYYIRVQSKTVMLIPARLWIPSAFQAHERNDYTIQAWYFGMVNAMVLFNILLFFLLRDVIYLLYVSSSLGIAISIAAINGLFKEFLFPDSTFWADKTLPCLVGISSFLFLMFMRKMLNTKEITPRLDQVIKLFMGIFILIIVLMTTIPLQVPAKPIVIIYLLTPFLVLIASVCCAFKKQRSAYLFLAAFFMFVMGAASLQMRNVGVLPTNFFTLNGLQIGSALEMVLMAIALANRFNLIRKEKENAQAQLLEIQQSLVENLKESEQILERRVLERTIALQTANKQLEALSTTDSLTGIANRRHFDNAFAIEWERAEHQKQPLALAVLDVDWFKKYNDHYGHQRGDDCLKNVAKILAASVSRKGDLVARYGGEEFVFIAPATDGNSALKIAQKICATLYNSALPHELSNFGYVTVSIGVAAIVPNVALKSENLLKAADKALYQAKSQGRNQAVLAN